MAPIAKRNVVSDFLMFTLKARNRRKCDEKKDKDTRGQRERDGLWIYGERE
jgi:hypothetical protein